MKINEPKKNKIVSSLLVLGLLSSSILPTQIEANTTNYPTDLHEIVSDTARESIMDLYDREKLGGYPDGTFRPYQNITRAEFMAMVLRIVGFEEIPTIEVNFKDSKPGQWHYELLKKSYALGLLKGRMTSDGQIEMSPGEKITRQEMLIIMVRTYEKKFGHYEISEEEIEEILNQYTDVEEISSWARIGMAKSVKYKISNGIGNNELGPKNLGNRLQSALFSYRLLDRVEDETPPSLSLNGNSVVNLEFGEVYEELGAVANDNLDGDISDSVVISGDNVNVNEVGTYVVKYNVKDSSNNMAEEITRTVNVIDTISPLLTLNGEAVVTLEVGEIYEELGAIANDNVDGDLSDSIVVGGDVVNVDEVGTYNVKYTVKDSSNNEAEIVRTVNVVDTISPVLTLIGEPVVTLELGESYQELGVVAIDGVEGDISDSVVIGGDIVDINSIGSYIVEYSVKDSMNNEADTVSRIVNVVDTTAPIMNLIGVENITLEVGEVYQELGVVATDEVDGDISASVVISGDIVDTNELGTYFVKYNVKDNSDNKATELIRKVNVVDTTPPTLDLVGDSVITLKVGEVYQELGVIATDEVDGDISSFVTIDRGGLNVNKAGTYVIKYNIKDSSNNVAQEITRTVNVVDEMPPKIALNGDSVVTLEVGETYQELGALAFDNSDGDISDLVVISGDVVDVNKVGIYIVRYNITDSSNNAAQEITRTVNVVDTGLPVLTLNGDSVVTLEVGETYQELGAAATDEVDGDISDSVVVSGDTVDINSVGSYVVEYNVKDSMNNEAEKITRTVNVIDTTLPTLNLNGDSVITIEYGDTYQELGVVATDNVDGDISDSVIISGDNVDTSKLGTYIVKYNVKDSSNNEALEITRTINVVDTTIPTMSLNGDANITLEFGDNYQELGVTATDNVDGDISSSVVVDGDIVDTNKLGTYIVRYNVKDSSNNEALEITRTINVVDTTSPEITLNGDSVVTTEVGKIYQDSGVVATDNVDGDISDSVIVGGDTVDVLKVGTYVIKYNVRDSSNNTAEEVTRTVNVVDGGIPVITLIGEEVITLEYGEAYKEEGAIAVDNVDGDISSSIEIGGDAVNVYNLGTYIVKYNVKDNSNNAAEEVVRTVNVVDTNAPTISLVGNSSIILEVGGIYQEAGADAFDQVDGDISNSVVISGDEVDTDTLGTYIVRYNVKDSSNNEATEVIRTVKIVDTTSPEITLNGSETIYLNTGQTYVEPGVTVTDNYDTNLEEKVVITGVVDINTVGEYQIGYEVQDNSNNSANPVTRTIIVGEGDVVYVENVDKSLGEVLDNLSVRFSTAKDKINFVVEQPTNDGAATPYEYKVEDVPLSDLLVVVENGPREQDTDPFPTKTLYSVEIDPSVSYISIDTNTKKVKVKDKSVTLKEIKDTIESLIAVYDLGENEVSFLLKESYSNIIRGDKHVVFEDEERVVFKEMNKFVFADALDIYTSYNSITVSQLQYGDRLDLYYWDSMLETWEKEPEHENSIVDQNGTYTFEKLIYGKYKVVKQPTELGSSGEVDYDNEYNRRLANAASLEIEPTLKLTMDTTAEAKYFILNNYDNFGFNSVDETIDFSKGIAKIGDIRNSDNLFAQIVYDNGSTEGNKFANINATFSSGTIVGDPTTYALIQLNAIGDYNVFELGETVDFTLILTDRETKNGAIKSQVQVRIQAEVVLNKDEGKLEIKLTTLP